MMGTEFSLSFGRTSAQSQACYGTQATRVGTNSMLALAWFISDSQRDIAGRRGMGYGNF